MKKFVVASWVVLSCFTCAFGQDAAVALDAKQLLGDWEYVSGTRDGEAVGAERLAGTVTITEETWTMPGGPDQEFVMSYKLDGSQDPATIDFKIEEGPVPEGEAKGLIAFNDGQITLCYNPMGGARPEKLESTEDNGAFLFVLKRKS